MSGVSVLTATSASAEAIHHPGHTPFEALRGHEDRLWSGIIDYLTVQPNHRETSWPQMAFEIDEEGLRRRLERTSGTDLSASAFDSWRLTAIVAGTVRCWHGDNLPGRLVGMLQQHHVHVHCSICEKRTARLIHDCRTFYVPSHIGKHAASEHIAQPHIRIRLRHIFCRVSQSSNEVKVIKNQKNIFHSHHEPKHRLLIQFHHNVIPFQSRLQFTSPSIVLMCFPFEILIHSPPRT